MYFYTYRSVSCSTHTREASSYSRWKLIQSPLNPKWEVFIKPVPSRIYVEEDYKITEGLPVPEVVDDSKETASGHKRSGACMNSHRRLQHAQGVCRHKPYKTPELKRGSEQTLICNQEAACN